MNTSEGVLSVRTAVALSRLDHLSYVRVRGSAAYEAIDRVFPREIYLRDGQVSHGLLLDERGRVLADCYLGSDEEEFLLLAEGIGSADLADHVASEAGGLGEVRVTDEGPAYVCIGLDGPYAWELLARIVGQEVIGLPYLTFFYFDGVLCCRAGKTGEYGYVLVTPAEAADRLWDRLLGAARDMDGAVVGLDVLDRCALENWFFNVRAEGRADATPLEFQLQWRLSRRKAFVGSEALARRREAGITQRLTCLVSDDGPAHTGDAVSRDGRLVGSVLNAAISPTRGDWVALALVDLAYAHPGIAGFALGDAAAPARSVSAPVVNNRSLYVNPQVHSYATRGETAFPDLRP